MQHTIEVSIETPPAALEELRRLLWMRDACLEAAKARSEEAIDLDQLKAAFVSADQADTYWTRALFFAHGLAAAFGSGETAYLDLLAEARGAAEVQAP